MVRNIRFTCSVEVLRQRRSAPPSPPKSSVCFEDGDNDLIALIAIHERDADVSGRRIISVRIMMMVKDEDDDDDEQVSDNHDHSYHDESHRWRRAESQESRKPR